MLTVHTSDIISFNYHNNFSSWYHNPILQIRNRFSSLPKVSHLVNGRARIWPQLLCLYFCLGARLPSRENAGGFQQAPRISPSVSEQWDPPLSPLPLIQWINPSGVFPSHSWPSQLWCFVVGSFLCHTGGCARAICFSSCCQPRISLHLPLATLAALTPSFPSPFTLMDFSFHAFPECCLPKMNLSIQYFKSTEMGGFRANRSTDFVSAT